MHGFHTTYQQSMTINKQWDNLVHGTLGHAIEHGQVTGSHMTLNVQHENSFILH